MKIGSEIISMKCVIFVNSLMGLISAVQIRSYYYPSCEFDIILSDMVPTLERIYIGGLLKEKFNKVFFVKYKNLSKFNKLLYLISPHIYVRRVLGSELSDYSDVFFWNPTLLLHGCINVLDLRKNEYRLHLYGDAIGSYVVDYPFEDQQFKNRILNYIFMRNRHFKLIKDLSYDYFIFGSEFFSIETKRKIVDIPQIKNDDLEYYNRLFSYCEDFGFEEKVVFMDKCHSDEFEDDNFGMKCIIEIARTVGYDNFIVKPHPRQDTSLYDKNMIRKLVVDFPWEIYCLNNTKTDKIIISYGSSALFMPYILSEEVNYTSICINIETNFNKIFRNEYSRFIETIRNHGKNIYVANNSQEIYRILNTKRYKNDE